MSFPEQNTKIGGSYVEREKLPKDFYRFLKEVDSVCAYLFTKTKDYSFKHAGVVASMILVVRNWGDKNEINRNPYYRKPSRECFKMFYEHIQQPYKLVSKKICDITGTNYDDEPIHMGLSLEELKQIDDARYEPDNHTTFTRGGFEIKEWRISE